MARRTADDELYQRFRVDPIRRPTGGLELEIRSLIRVLRAVRAELRPPVHLPWRRRLRAWRRGFSSKSEALYRLGENDPAEYVSDLSTAFRAYKINGFFNPIVGNKLVLAQVLAGYGIPHPRVLALVNQGRLVDIEGRLETDTAPGLDRLLRENAALVFRPHWAGAGEGIFFLRGDGSGRSINGTAATEAEVARLIGGLDRYVVTAFVQQASYAQEIFPGAANTLRVLTLWDEGGPFVAAAVHRFGTARSLPIDNWHQGRGGVCASIDRQAGTLGRAVRLDEGGRLEWLSHHPETGSAIEGVRIPGLEEALDGILRTARCFPGAPCVGWDAVITDGGVSILEGNAPPGLFVWQVHAPLLADERTARFFGRFGFPLPTRRRT